MNFSEEEKEAYESHLKWLRIESNTLKKAEEKGREEGRQEGLQEGRQERDREIALKMLKRDRPLKEIAEDTGLSIEEIKSLQK